MTKRKPNQMVQMNLRLREELRKRIEGEAKKHGHSLNRELVSRLERSFEQDQLANIQKLLQRLVFG